MLRRAGDLASIRGRFDEAIALYRRAIEQDPLSAAAHGNLGFAFDAAGRLADGEQALRRALLLAPQRSNARASLARNLLAQGRDDEALAEALRESEEWARLWALAIIHHAAGRPAEADAALRELIAKHAEAAAYQVAEVYAARGETDLAFEWLERAYDASDPGLELDDGRTLASSRCTSIRGGAHSCARWDSPIETATRQRLIRRCRRRPTRVIVPGRKSVATTPHGHQEARRAAPEICRREGRRHPRPGIRGGRRAGVHRRRAAQVAVRRSCDVSRPAVPARRARASAGADARRRR